MVELPEPTRRTEPIWLEPYPDALLEEVLDLYVRTFGLHPKLELRHANARLLEGEQWDFFYADICRQLLTRQAIGDMAGLCSANAVGRYHWWSIEQAVPEVLQAG